MTTDSTAILTAELRGDRVGLGSTVTVTWKGTWAVVRPYHGIEGAHQAAVGPSVATTHLQPVRFAVTEMEKLPPAPEMALPIAGGDAVAVQPETCPAHLSLTTPNPTRPKKKR